MAKQQAQQPKINYCKDCRNAATETYQNIYFCSVKKTSNHSIFGCVNFKLNIKKP